MRRTGKRDWTVGMLVLYGILVTALAVVGTWRQAQFVQRLRHTGDPGVALRPAEDGRGYRVTEIAPQRPAAQVLKVGDRVLRIGDVELPAVRPPARAPTPARRRQMRTIQLGLLPWLALQSGMLLSGGTSEPRRRHRRLADGAVGSLLFRRGKRAATTAARLPAARPGRVRRDLR